MAACLSILAGVLLLGGVAGDAAATPRVERIRYFSGPDHTRVVLDLSGPAAFEVRRVRAPERIAINVVGARFASTTALVVDDGLVRRIRRNAGATRAQVVLDLTVPARHEAFALSAAGGRPHRIVVDVLRGGTGGEDSSPTPHADTGATTSPLVVIIDPGHGGLDPGAIRGGVREKDIVLDVSRRLARRLNALPGYRAELTRDRDWYPSLARRVQIAREERGDLFLSVHCNTHRRRNLRGMEVYFLSLQGATDREAQELADAENAADLVGLAPEDDPSDLVVSILMDLRMTRVLHDSQRFCLELLNAARDSDLVPGRKVKQARFQVLRSLAMPSALVELAYMSNETDRRMMNSESGREALAALLETGIRRYREGREAPVVAAVASAWTHRYRVQRGDSLWRLAKRHGTTIDEISRQNELRSPRLRVGQLLTLPEIE